MSLHIVFFILGLLFSTQSFSLENALQEESISTSKNNPLVLKLSSGDGKFLTREGDNQESIKKVLFFYALKDLITRELKSIGVDPNIFWRKFDDKFELSLNEQKRVFLAKKEEQYKNDGTRLRKEKIERDWIIETAPAKVDFMGLSNVLSTYNITRLNRSPQNPLIRYMTIQGEIGKQILGQLYRKMIQEGPVKDFVRVYLYSKFDLVNCTWNELGVDSENDFTKVVKSHWLDWLKNHLRGDIHEFEIADEGILRNIEEEIKDAEEKDAAKKWEGLLANEINGDYADAVLVKINVIIKKTNEDLLNQTRNIEVSTDYMVKGIGPNYVVLTEDIEIPKKEYSVKDAQEYSSALATSVYQSPLVSLSDLKRSLQSVSPSYRVLKLELGNVFSLTDLTKIQEYMENLNPGRQVKSSIISQSGKQAIMELKINGNKDEISRFLNSLDNAKVTEGKVLLVKNKLTPYMLELRDVHQSKP